jgi:cyclopropane fatty-acyl-phospholipid synthase-like methyltransferase
MLGFQDDEDYRLAKETLLRGEYTEDAVRRIVGRANVLSVPAIDVPRCLRHTRPLRALDTLVRLFLLGESVPLDAARHALEPPSLEAWAAAGLISPNPGADVAPEVQVTPVGGLVLASDTPRRPSAATQRDFVMPPGSVSLQLAHAAIPRPEGRILDLGTGCGLLGLLGAERAGHVVGTDNNPRAVAFTELNARLNQIQNVEARAGELFDPVAGMRFDLILSNPPFVISPTRRYTFRDSGTRGDEFCRRLIRSVPSHLEEGGYCQLTCNVTHESDRSWKEALAEWFEGLDCDVIVWLDKTEDASDYAMTWIISTESRSEDEVTRLYDAWMDYFDRHRIEAISYVLVNMRRAKGGGRTVIDDVPRRVAGPCGDEVLRCFAVEDYLSARPRTKLLDARFVLSPQTRIEQQHAMTSEGLAVAETRLATVGGSQSAMGLDASVAGLLVRCDGNRALGDLLQEMAGTLGVEPEKMIQAALGIVGTLIRRGVLLPEGLP